MEYEGQYETGKAAIGPLSGSGYQDASVRPLRAPAAQQLEPRGRLSSALDETAQLTEVLSKEVSLLEQSLSLVLRPTAPDTPAGSSGEAKRREPSPIASGVEQVNLRLRNTAEYIRAIRSRIDL